MSLTTRPRWKLRRLIPLAQVLIIQELDRHSYFKEIGRAEYAAVTDTEAIKALQLVSKLEGIIPALETAHAFAYLEKLCPTLNQDSEIVINCSGRGDKDVNTVAEKLGPKI